MRRILFFISFSLITHSVISQNLAILHTVKFYNNNSLDADAVAFLNAVGGTNSIQQSAINTFVVQMKAKNLWSKMYAIYPFIGLSAAQDKWNLKDPRDLDAAFRLTFNGASPNFNFYGIDWPSINTVNANTHFNLRNFDKNNIGFTAYIGKDTIYGTILGAFDGSTSLIMRELGGRFVNLQLINYSAPTLAVPQPIFDFFNSHGSLTGNRTSSTKLAFFHNGIKFGSDITNTETANAPNANIFLNNITINQSGYQGNSRMQFVAIHQGLSDSETGAFDTLVNNLQLALHRNFTPLPVYWFLGNSITHGQASTGHGGSWPGIVSLNKGAYEQNIAMPSYSAISIISSSLSLLPNKTYLDEYLFLSIGINDAGITDTATFHSQMRTILDSVITRGYDSTNIILPTIYWTPSRGAVTPPYNVVINQLWDEYHLQIKPDVYQAIVDDGRGADLYHPDGLHPINPGHAVVATCILNSLP